MEHNFPPEIWDKIIYILHEQNDIKTIRNLLNTSHSMRKIILSKPFIVKEIQYSPKELCHLCPVLCCDDYSCVCNCRDEHWQDDFCKPIIIFGFATFLLMLASFIIPLAKTGAFSSFYTNVDGFGYMEVRGCGYLELGCTPTNVFVLRTTIGTITNITQHIVQTSNGNMYMYSFIVSNISYYGNSIYRQNNHSCYYKNQIFNPITHFSYWVTDYIVQCVTENNSLFVNCLQHPDSCQSSLFSQPITLPYQNNQQTNFMVRILSEPNIPQFYSISISPVDDYYYSIYYITESLVYCIPLLIIFFILTALFCTCCCFKKQCDFNCYGCQWKKSLRLCSCEGTCCFITTCEYNQTLEVIKIKQKN